MSCGLGGCVFKTSFLTTFQFVGIDLPHAFTILMAGAGIKGGLVHGATDRYAEFVTDDPVLPEDITATIFDSRGIDPHQSVPARDKQHQLSTGRPLAELFS